MFAILQVCGQNKTKQKINLQVKERGVMMLLLNNSTTVKILLRYFQRQPPNYDTGNHGSFRDRNCETNLQVHPSNRQFCNRPHLIMWLKGSHHMNQPIQTLRCFDSFSSVIELLLTSSLGRASQWRAHLH